MRLIKWLKLKFLRYTLSAALKNAAPERFTTSRPKSLRNDFHETHLLDKNNSITFLVRSIDGNGVTGTRHNSDGTISADTILNEKLLNYTFYNQHHYRGYNISTNSCTLFLLRRFFFIDYMAVQNEKIAQFLFNKKKLSRIQRMEVLSLIVKNTVGNADYRTSNFKLISELYPTRTIFHPEHQRLSNYYALILDSLESDGYLKKNSHSYQLSPAGVAGLIRFETEDQRFKQAMWHNRLLAVLTLGLVLTGIIQAAITYLSRS